MLQLFNGSGAGSVNQFSRDELWAGDSTSCLLVEASFHPQP